MQIVITSCNENKNKLSEPLLSCGVLTDARDGQNYKTVKIGDKCWMAENLNIGIMIDGQKNQTDNDTIEKYCYNNHSENCDIYGGLYQWHEIMQYTTGEKNQGICPEDWYVPSDNDWKKMEIALGMSENDANKENAWRGQNIGNALKKDGYTGFNVLFAGQRTTSGDWAQIENSEMEFAYFYTSTEAENDFLVWRRCFNASQSSIGRFNTSSKNNGFSLRCIKDIN